MSWGLAARLLGWVVSAAYKAADSELPQKIILFCPEAQAAPFGIPGHGVGGWRFCCSPVQGWVALALLLVGCGAAHPGGWSVLPGRLWDV